MENIYKDYNTRNVSFINVSKQLRKYGVKNNDFMLTIYDKDLIGIDPSDKNIDENTQKRIIEECKKNIWYFFREVLKVKCQGGGDKSFELNLVSLTMIYLALQLKDQYVISHRLSYKTHTAKEIQSYFEKYHTNTNVLHIQDAEYYSKNKNDLLELYQKTKNKDTVQIYESVICDEDKNNFHSLTELTKDWNISYFDLPSDELYDFYYVYYDYTELVDNPEEFLEKMKIMLGHDEDIIRREVLCQRKE